MNTTLQFMVISGIRNHEKVQSSHGYAKKQCIQLCGQLFERKKMRVVRVVSGVQNETWIRSLPKQELWKTEISEATAEGNCNRERIL